MGFGSDTLRQGSQQAIGATFFNKSIDQSLRFEDGDEPSLSKTYSTAQTNTKIITVSVWVKRGDLGRRNSIMHAKDGSGGWFEFGADDKLRWNPYNTGYNGFISTRVFRDTSAWYHIVATADSENQSGYNIYNVYVNGEQLTNSDGSSHVPDDTATKILANGVTTRIGDNIDASTYHFNGYMAEMHVIDGSIYGPEYFGENKNGIWIPKQVSGVTYGTNGFHLDFKDQGDGFAAYFDGSGDNITWTHANNFDIGTSDDFCVEFFFNGDYSGTYSYAIGDYQNSGFLIQFSSSRNLYFYYGISQSIGPFDVSSYVGTDTYHHYAFARHSGTYYIYVDGVQRGTSSTGGTAAFDNARFQVGDAHPSAGAPHLLGYISNLRFTVGSARYPSGTSFTAPTSTLTSDSTDVKLLAFTNSTITNDASSYTNTGVIDEGAPVYSSYGPFGAGLSGDKSGNDNHFLTNNITDIDILLDTPTNNFCTLNSIAYTNGITLSEGNLTMATTTNNRGVHGTMSLPSSGKWYYEIRVDSYASGGGTYIGWGTDASLGFDEYASNKGIFFSGYNEQVLLDNSGQSGGYGSTGTNVATNGDIYSVLLDVDNGRFYYAKNGTYFNSANPSAGTGGLDVSATLAAAITNVVPTITRGGSYNETYSVNFGQNPSFSGTLTGGNVGTAVGGGGIWKYAPPTGYKALKASNLPEPILTPRNDSIEKSFFYTVLYEGNGGGQRVGQFLPLNEVKTVNNAIRFEDGDTPYLYRTPGSAGNQRTWTWSSWIKRGNITLTGSNHQTVFSCGTKNTQIRFHADTDTLDVLFGGSTDGHIRTTEKFRNTSNWFHIVVAVDTTQSTDSDRCKVYIDGTLVSNFTTETYPIQDYDTGINNNELHSIGRSAFDSNRYFDGYIADAHLVDGQALGPTFFGQTDPSTEKWIPKTFTGNHGQNGFHLEFLNNTVGADSANTNSFTPVSLTTANTVIDTPTKNYPTFDGGNLNSWTLSKGSLYASVSSNNKSIKTTIPIFPNTGKWYWEVLRTNTASGGGDTTFLIGLTKTDSVLSDNPYSGTNNYSLYDYDGTLYFEGTNLTPYGSKNQTADDIHMIAYDSFTGATWFGVNGTWYNSATASEIANGNTTNAAFIIPKHEQGHVPFLGRTGGTNAAPAVINFGQNPSFAGELTGGAIGTASDGLGSLFKYAPPTGYKALNVDNLPFKNTRGIARRKTPALTWIKNRDVADYHVLTDQIRGANKFLKSNATDAQTEDYNTLQKFLPGGFQLGDKGQVNTAGESYVAWNWCMHDDIINAGTVSNTDGDITSTVLADKKLGFSMGTFTKGSGAQTVGHGLSQAPDMYVVKRYTGGTGSWYIYHKDADSSAPEDYYLRFNSNSTVTDDATLWNDTAPTNSVFTVAGAFNSGEELLFYAWHSVPGFSKFGSFSGNNNDDGTYIDLGFKPAWAMIKPLFGQPWSIIDNTRNPSNINDSATLAVNTVATVESGYADNAVDFLSSGFKLRDAVSGASYINGSYTTIIYWAMAESPFKYANAR